jgi:HK97 family phage major capsid protein
MPVEQKDIDLIVNQTKAIKEDTTKLFEAAQRDLAALRSELDTVSKKAQLDPVFVNKIDTIAASVETLSGAHEKDKAVLASLETRADALEAVNKRPGVRGGWANDDEAKAAKDAFEFHKARLVSEGKLKASGNSEPDREAIQTYFDAFPIYMRSRPERLSVDINAAMTTGSDPDGGYTVTPTYSTKVVSRVYETSNLRALADVQTIAGKELIVPRDEGEFGFGGWVGETTAPSETSTAQLGESKIAVHEMFSEPRVTQQMLEDSGLDVESWVANKVGQKFGRIEATSFFTGTGTNQPRGILTYANWTTPGVTQNGAIEQIASGASGALTADGIYNLVYSLKDFYNRNASFLMSRTVVRDTMKLKDGQGNYLWQMGDVKNGQPSTLMTYAINREEDMPVVATNALAVAFGDFKSGYQIVDRLGITLLRDNLTAKPYVKFYNRRRVGADVINFEAFKLLKVG